MTPGRGNCVVLILDGLGDLPVAGLGGLTPLEAAETPVLNRMAAAGQYGMVDPVGRGTVPNTHSGCGMLLGLRPEQTSRLKRGPVEAAGAGRVLQSGELAFRANFATLESNADGLQVVDRRAGRILSGTRELAAELDGMQLDDEVRAWLQPTDQHRAVLTLSGPGLHDAVTDTDPGDGSAEQMVMRCTAREPGAEKTAQLINQFVQQTYQRLVGHPVNRQREEQGLLPATGVITRGAGAAFSLDSEVTAKGLEAAVVAGCNTVLGMARILGYETITEACFTADAHTDLVAKVAAAIAALRHHDLVFLHIKAPDLFSHDQQAAAKRDFIERVDTALAVIEAAGVRLALTADHTTDSNSGMHTADPVPSLISDPSRPVNSAAGAVKFGEQSCRSGNMPRQQGHDFLMNVIGRVSD